MANLWGSMNSAQAVQMGQGMLGMGLETMFKKQAMDIEKQKMDLTKMLQQAEMKMAKERMKVEQDKLKLLQDAAKLEADKAATEKEEKEEGKTSRANILFGGRRRVTPQGQALPMFDTRAEKAAANEFARTGQLGYLNFLKPQKPEGAFTLGQGQTRFGPQGTPIASVPAKEEKPNYARYKASKGGLYDVETKTWEVEPPKKDEPVTMEHLQKATETLDKLGMKDVYWDAPWFGVNKIRKDWLEKFIGGREVSPDLAASLKAMFPDMKLEVSVNLKKAPEKYKKAFELWKETNPQGTYEQFLKELQG